MDITCYSVPQECYPLYNYTLKYARPLLKRYGTLLESLELSDEFPLPSFGTVIVVFVRKQQPNTQSDVLVACTHAERINCTSEKYDEYLGHIEASKSHGATIFITYPEILNDHKNELELKDCRTIVIENVKCEHSIFRASNEYPISTPQELPEQIDLYLERVVIETFYERMKVLECLLELKEVNASLYQAEWSSGQFSVYGRLTAQGSVKKKKRSVIILPKRNLDGDTEEASAGKRPNILSERSVQLNQECDLYNVAKGAPSTSKRSDSAKHNAPHSVEKNTSHQFSAFLERKLDTTKKQIGEIYGNLSTQFRDNLIRTLMSKGQCPSNISDQEMIQFITVHNQEEITQLEIQEFQKENNDVKAMFKLVSQEHHLKESFKEHVVKVNAFNSVVEQLFAEMNGMLYRSSIPQQDRPKFEIDTSKVLSKTDAQEILSVQGVTSVGYRFRTLEIFLDDSYENKYVQQAKQDLERILAKRNILIYRFRTEQKYLTRFREVGSALAIHNTATLGGFAKLGNNEEICILLARHFARQGQIVYIRNDQERSQFAHVLPFGKHFEPSTDIALARVVEAEISNCRFQFKNDSGRPLQSILCLFEDLKSLNAMPVHIWGASSSPGYGLIVSQVHYMIGEEDPVLRIEDRNPEQGKEIERFAELGDSGAIVCAETKKGKAVLVIAMLSGSPNFNNTEHNLSQKREYIAFRLDLGLDQLKTEHNKDITLY